MSTAASNFVTTTDGAQIFFKDWGSGRPIVFSHVGRSHPTTGTRRCCSSCITATA